MGSIALTKERVVTFPRLDDARERDRLSREAEETIRKEQRRLLAAGKVRKRSKQS